ncbi:MAG: phosphoribosyltransferase [Nanoarchaeota archaeon]|nr:phosphoribosyltransferase [Nanoarchaeota archaeon]
MDYYEPSDEMEFQEKYISLFLDIETSLKKILDFEKSHKNPKNKTEIFAEGNNIYFKASALVNVVLNHKIAVENGLELHKKRYVKFSKQTNVEYAPHIIKNSQDLYIEAISLVKDIYALKEGSIECLKDFKSKIPEEFHDFIYTSKKDKYTWMASHPKRIRDLADEINKKSKIDLIIGAAHGSIISATLLSNIINSSVYFIRFSQFKRKDNNPIISKSDMRYLSNYKEKNILLFDEDLASGKTLKNLEKILSPNFINFYTGAVIRHYSAYKPDFVAETWFD